MRGIYQQGKVFYISFGYKGKRYREPAGSSFQLARSLLATRKAQVIENYNKRTQDPERIKFAKFADMYLEEHCKVENSAWESSERFLKEFKTFFGDKYLDEITVNDIERFKGQKIKTCAPATVNRHLNCLSSLFNKAKIRWNYFKGDNPVSLVKKFKENNERNRFLTVEEFDALLKASNPYLQIVIIFAVNSGMRTKEIKTLQWTQCDFTNRVISLIKTKGDKKREIPMNEVVFDILTSLKDNKSKWVFCKPDGSGRPYGSWRTAFEGARKRAKVEDFKFHDQRHTFASWLLMTGKVDLYTIQQLLGHSTPKMTQRYTHLSMAYKHNAVNSLNGMHSIITPLRLNGNKDSKGTEAISGEKQKS